MIFSYFRKSSEYVFVLIEVTCENEAIGFIAQEGEGMLVGGNGQILEA